MGGRNLPPVIWQLPCLPYHLPSWRLRFLQHKKLCFLLIIQTEIRRFESLNNQESNLKSGYYMVHNSSTALTFSMFMVLAFGFLLISSQI